MSSPVGDGEYVVSREHGQEESRHEARNPSPGHDDTAILREVYHLFQIPDKDR
jgi:hypothetical protein